MRPQDLKQVGRYEVLAKVGEGANGMVFRAQDPTIRRIVALKVLAADDDELSNDTSTRSGTSLFQREAQAAGALLHTNIVTLYDAGRDGDWYYLAMEFIEGENFADEIAREGPISPPRALEVTIAVADALHFAHERGVVHRDIKPANLMILPDRTVKVADFGIARLTSASATMTTDMVVGTPNYMSPEQVRGAKVDGRSDIFSLGVLLYEALAGQKPFRAENLAALLNQIMNSTPTPVHEVNPLVPKALGQVVARMMERDIDKRFANGGEVADALRALAAPRTAGSQYSKDGSSGSSKGLWAGGAAALAAVGLGATLWFQPGGDVGPEPPAAYGYTEFVTSPQGAEILVDGQIVGQTPYMKELPVGTYEVEFRLSGHYPTQVTIEVAEGEPSHLAMDLTPR